MGQKRQERLAARAAKQERGPVVTEGTGYRRGDPHLIRQAGRHTKSKRGRGKG